MPVLAFRLATPSLLVDLRRLPGLGNIAVGDDGFRFGALVRWRDIQRIPALRRINTAALFTAVPKVRIRFPPAGSPQTLGPIGQSGGGTNRSSWLDL
jgi:CO/xanthine dehydrogenase FAD-binding subunit